LFSEFALKPNKTGADFQQAFLQFPEFEKSLTESYKGYTEDKLASSLTEQGSVLAALEQKKPDFAKQILTNRLTGLKNAGAPENQIAAVQQAIQQIDEQPEIIKTMTRARLLAQGDRGKAIVENIDKQLGAGGKIFASVEDKIRAGIVDEKGNALPGTWTRSESGTLQRISEKAPDQFGTYTREEVAQRLGKPIDQVTPGLYSYNKTTQKYDLIGGAGPKIQIDMGGRADVAYATGLGGALAKEDAEIVSTARNAPESVKKIDSTLRQLYASKALTGAFADSIKAIERVRAKFGSDYAAGRVSDTEVLDAMLGSDVFPMIGELGIGARGLDTPAEREFLRQVMTGTVSMDKNSLIRLAEMRRDRIERNVQSFNQMLADGELDNYFAVSKRVKRPVELPPRLKRPSGLLPPVGAEPSKTKPEQPTPGKPLGLGTRSIKGVVTPAESFPVAPQPQVSSQDIDAMINYWSQKYGIDR